MFKVLLAFAYYTRAIMKGGVKMLTNIIKNPKTKKVVGIVSVIIAGLLAVDEAISEQKRDEEIEDMKKTISELKKK